MCLLTLYLQLLTRTIRTAQVNIVVSVIVCPFTSLYVCFVMTCVLWELFELTEYLIHVVLVGDVICLVLYFGLIVLFVVN